MEQSIVFGPEIPGRELDREVSKIDDRLADVDETIQPEVDGGGLDGIGGVGGGGGGAGGEAIAAGVEGLSSKLPESIGAVSAGAAMPVAMAGAAGVGMLSAMESASASMQTSTNLLGQAWNNVWRPIGDKTDQLFIRPVAKDLLSETQQFEETLRKGEWAKGIAQLMTGVDFDTDSLGEKIGGVLGGSGGLLAGGLAGAKAGGTAGAALGSIIPGAGTAVGAAGGSIVGAVIGALGGSKIGGELGKRLGQLVSDKFPGWPDLSGMWPGWPAIADMFPGWPDISGMWPGWPKIMELWPGWPTETLDSFSWPSIGTPEWPTANDILGQFPELSVSSLRSAILGGNDTRERDREDDTTTGGDNGGILDPITDRIPGLQTGGRVQRTGIAEVHRGEMVADPDRLVSELADAIGTAGGGGGGAEIDMSPLISEIQDLKRETRRTRQALSQLGFEVDGERFGRVVQDKRQNRVGDTNPLL